MHSDIKKRRSFVALLFAAGDARRWASKTSALTFAMMWIIIAIKIHISEVFYENRSNDP